MEDLSKIRNKILKKVKKKNPDLLKKVKEELDILEKTEGINEENNLNAFFNIWRKNKDKKGDKNDVNSWTAYALGMTSKKPDEEFLPSRRAFARVGFPDIDVDFEDERRDEIYDYLIDKYGRENVGNIGTHGMLNFKSCVTRVIKVLDIADSFHKGPESYTSDNFAKVREILEPFPKVGIVKVRDAEGKFQVIKSFSDAYKYSEDFKFYMDKYPEIKKHCEYIEGVFANFGCLSKDTPILTNKGYIRIDQLTTKIKIAYIDKDKKIKYTNNFIKFKTGNKKIYRLRLINGSFIDVTDEHLIFTDKGCVEFGKIRKNPNKYKIYGLKKEEL